MIAELTTDARPVIAVQPGRYGIRVKRDGKLVAGRITVAANEKRVVKWEELIVTEVVTTRRKGPDDDVAVAAAAAPRLVIAGGVGAASPTDSA